MAIAPPFAPSPLLLWIYVLNIIFLFLTLYKAILLPLSLSECGTENGPLRHINKPFAKLGVVSILHTGDTYYVPYLPYLTFILALSAARRDS